MEFGSGVVGAHGLCWKLCSYMFIMFINYIEMVRTDVEKLVNDKVIHGIQK